MTGFRREQRTLAARATGRVASRLGLDVLLTGSDDWQVELAAQALHRAYPEELAAVIPSLRRPRPVGPSAFWLRRA
jgi:hypothetical protein